MDKMDKDHPRYSVQRNYLKRSYNWLDWHEVPEEIREDAGNNNLDKYIKQIPIEVVILLLKEFQNDTGLIGKIMQEEIYSKDMSRRHLDIIEKLIGVVAGK